MVEKGKFDSDANALKERIKSHDKYSLYDINEWIFNHIEIEEGMHVLDIGCGTGKQALPIAKLVGEAGMVYAVDISKEALEELKQAAVKNGVEKQIRVLNSDIDKFKDIPKKQLLDRALSSYSLYYASHPERVLQYVHSILKPNGIFFFCGPSIENNIEIRKFHYSLKGIEAPEDKTGAFMERDSPRLARQFFKKVETFSFQNPVRFDNADALYKYWSSYNLYDANIDSSFKNAAYEHFKTNKVFETVKRVIGVKAIK